MEIANYTTRKQYMSDYAKAHRAEINAKKREWRKARKNLNPVPVLADQRQSITDGNEVMDGLEARESTTPQSCNDRLKTAVSTPATSSGGIQTAFDKHCPECGNAFASPEYCCVCKTCGNPNKFDGQSPQRRKPKEKR